MPPATLPRQCLLTGFQALRKSGYGYMASYFDQPGECRNLGEGYISEKRCRSPSSPLLGRRLRLEAEPGPVR